MKSIYVLLAIFVAQAKQELLTGADLEKALDVIKDVDTMKLYVDCYLKKGPCDEIGSKIINQFVYILENACADCNSEQKHVANRLIGAYAKALPEEFEEARKMYDPELAKIPKLLAALEKY